MEKLDFNVRQKFVNDLSNFLCKKISGESNLDTIISVVDFDNVIFIKGITSNSETHNTNTLINGFENNDYPKSYMDNLKTIDIINYGIDKEKFNYESITISNQIKLNTHNPMTISSNYPNGYNDKSLIIYNLIDSLKPYFKYENFTVSVNIDSDIMEFNSIETDSYYSDDKILSIIKDNLDGDNLMSLDIKNKFFNVI